MEKRLTLMICVILLLYFCMVSCDSKPSGIDSQDLVGEKQLQTEHTSKEILDNAVALFSDDFDSNGKEEAFVLLEPESNNYIGSEFTVSIIWEINQPKTHCELHTMGQKHC